MILRHKHSKQDHPVTREQYERLKALNMDREYIIIDQSELETKEIEIDTEDIVKDIEELISLPIEEAILSDGFDSNNYKVDEIREFIANYNYDKEKFKNDKRITIQKLINNE